MAVIIAPPPRPNPFGRGLMQAADAFASGVTQRREREERDKILRRGTLNSFLDKALKSVKTEDQASRIFDAIEKNNELEPGSIPQEVRTLLLGDANLNQELVLAFHRNKKAVCGPASVRSQAMRLALCLPDEISNSPSGIVSTRTRFL